MSRIEQASGRIFIVSHTFGHHMSRSGYRQLLRYIPAEEIAPGRLLHAMGETALRVPAKLVSWYGGSFEYSRHDFVKECAVLLHMLRHRNCIYHFLQGEKSYKLLAHFHGFRGHRFVATFHHPASHFRWLFRSTGHLKRLDRVIALSRAQARFLGEIAGEERVTFIPHGVDTDYFRPLDAGGGTDRLRCFFAGVHMRDFKTLAAIARKVSASLPETDFVIISHDRGVEHCRGIRGVRILRGVSDAEYLDLLRNSTVAVIPLVESVAVTTVLEALACGIPVVTNRGGISDYLSDACALQYEAGDGEGMAAGTLELLKDVSRRKRMARAARARAEELAWPRIADEMMDDVYRKLGAGSGSGRG